MHKDSNLVLISILTISLYAFSCDSNASTKTQFNIMETTIAKVHHAFENGDPQSVGAAMGEFLQINHESVLEFFELHVDSVS